MPAAQTPAEADERIALYRSLLATRQILILLDNAADAAQVHPLLPGSSGCAVIVTSRHRLTGLVAVDGARAIGLAVMSTEEATEMLATRLGPAHVASHPDAVDQIIDRCAGLPLGLAVAARAVADEVPLHRLAAELGRPLDALATGDAAADVRSVLSWSYRPLPDSAARMFRLLGVHPGPDIGIAAAASLAAVPATTAEALLRELTRANLLTEHRPGRFACHDLLRAYAVELAATCDTDDALARVMDHYTRTAHTAAILLDPLRDQVEPPPPIAGAQPEPLTDTTAALTWYAAEYQVLTAATEAAWAHGLRPRPPPRLDGRVVSKPAQLLARLARRAADRTDRSRPVRRPCVARPDRPRPNRRVRLAGPVRRQPRPRPPGARPVPRAG